MNHEKKVIEPASDFTPEQATTKTQPDRSYLAKLYPTVKKPTDHKPKEYIVPIFSTRILLKLAVLITTPYIGSVLWVDFLRANVRIDLVIFVFPAIVIGLIVWLVAMILMTQYVAKQIESLYYNESTYLVLYFICVIPPAGLLYGISRSISYGSFIFPLGLISISIIVFLLVGRLLSRLNKKPS